MEVLLHVYKLGNTDNFWYRTFLPSVGMGLFHTCIQINGKVYTFDASRGIITQSMKSINIHRLSDGSQLEETISLGTCPLQPGEIQQIIQKLGTNYFHEKAYHLIHRNCNHFSETLALALIYYQDLIDQGPDPKILQMSTFPHHINRLASTSGIFVKHDSDIVPCKPVQEAAMVVGASEKIGWNLSHKYPKQIDSSKKKEPMARKKELTEAQKAALDKLRNK